MKKTPLEAAKARYNIAHWSDGYVTINAHGEIEIQPHSEGAPHARIALAPLMQQLKKQGLTPPVLLRFDDILQHRIKTLQQAFAEAIAQKKYPNSYTAVYPIKVNQQYQVVKTIARTPGIGLEAGSKAELLAILALAPQANTVIICNGYKDPAYIRLALLGRQLGHDVHLIIEKLSDLDLILQQATALNVTPKLGVRVRLASIARGKWQNTGGAKSKFGLTAAQLITLLDQLKAAGQLSQLRCLHCHLGSQIANIRDIQRGLQECAQYFAQLRQLNVPIDTVDVGGGLGVDYEGTRSRHFCSMNYTIAEYAKQIVHALHDVCQRVDLPAPRLITESGRALTAHHAVLITEVVGCDRQHPQTLHPPSDEQHRVLHELWHVWIHLNTASPLESYHEASHLLSEAQSLYCHQIVSLQERAQAEQYSTAIETKLLTLLSSQRRAERDILDQLQHNLSDNYFCNFSVFRSLPDIWAIQQIFPILPLSNLDQPLTERAVLQDLTCDSDGRIDLYVDGEGLGTHLALPPAPLHTPHYLGLFLVGAYQEILGDIHNLFGSTHAVSIAVQADGSYQCQHAQPGDSIADVLEAVNFDAPQVLKALTTQLQASALSTEKQALVLEELKTTLAGYTYLT